MVTKTIKVRDIMTRGIIKVGRDTLVIDAMKTMLDRRVTSLIVEAENGSDWGIITRKDIVNKVVACRSDPKKIKVKDIMSIPLLTVHPDMTVDNVARLMAKTNIRRFAVSEGNDIIGVVSNSDIFKAVTLELLEEEQR